MFNILNSCVVSAAKKVWNLLFLIKLFFSVILSFAMYVLALFCLKQRPLFHLKIWNICRYQNRTSNYLNIAYFTSPNIVAIISNKRDPSNFSLVPKRSLNNFSLRHVTLNKRTRIHEPRTRIDRERGLFRSIQYVHAIDSRSCHESDHSLA